MSETTQQPAGGAQPANQGNQGNQAAATIVGAAPHTEDTMTETTPAATTAPPRRRSHTVPNATRDWGVSHQRPLDALQMATWTKRERALLRHLLTAIKDDGSADPVSRAELETSASMMQNLYNNGLVSGAGSPDARGSGNTPETSWWWLTSSGEALARHLAQEGR